MCVPAQLCFLRCECELVIPGLEAARACVHLFLIVSCERPRRCVCIRISVCISGRVWVVKGGCGICLRVSACPYLCECDNARVLVFHVCCVYKDLCCVGVGVLRIQECVCICVLLVHL